MRSLFTSLLLTWSFALQLQAQAQLQVVTFNAPPYSFVANKQQAGYATEVVKAALAEMGQNVTIDSYPMIRGIYKAKADKNILIYPLIRHQYFESDFHWIEKVSSSRNYLFRFHSREDIQISSLQEAANYTIGVVRGSPLVSSLENNGIKYLSEVTSGIQNLLKLKKNRIDLLASDELELSHLIDRYNQENQSNKLSIQMFQKVSPIPASDNDMYIAMSKRSDIKLVNLVKAAFKSALNSGKLIEVAHFWTNQHEQAQVNVYKTHLARQGFKWVDYTYQGGGGENLATVLETRKQNDHLPHAMQHYVGPQIKSWAKSGLLLPLNDIAKQQNWDERIPAAVRDSISYNGQYYAAPANFQRVNWMWLNASVFKQAGMPIPATWNEFFEAAEKLQDLGITPVALGRYAWQEGTLFEAMLLGLGGVDFHRSALIELNPEAFRSATMAKVLRSLRKVISYTGANRQDRTWVQATKMLIDGEAAVYFMGDWVKPIFDKNNFPYGDKGYLCMPVPGTEEVFLSNVDSFVFPDSGYIHRDGQAALAEIIMSNHVQREFNLHKGSIPVRSDVPLTDYDECSQLAAETAQKHKVIPSFNFIQTQPREIQKRIIDIVSHFINSNDTVEDKLAQLYQVVSQYNNSCSSLPPPVSGCN